MSSARLTKNTYVQTSTLSKSPPTERLDEDLVLQKELENKTLRLF